MSIFRKKDPNTTAAKQVSEVTKTPLPKGSDLLGSPELRLMFSKAKRKEKRTKREG